MVNQILRTHTARIQDTAHRPEHRLPAGPVAGSPGRGVKL
jgi:hypothetical protein